MDTLLPPEIVFYRTPIPIEEQNDSEPAVAPSEDIQTPDFSATVKPSAKEPLTLTPIYGSVTLFDIRAAVQALLAGDAATVVPSVSIISDEGKDAAAFDSTRIKALGSFPVNLQVRNWEPLRRTVVVKPLEQE